MTKKEMFAEVIALAKANGREDIVTFAEHEVELLAKKGSSNSKAKKESDERAEKLYNALAEMEEPVTLTELATLASDPEVREYTNQRMSALVRKLGDRVNKEMRGKKAYFSIA